MEMNDMPAWVLIIWFVGANIATTTHEFVSKEACDNAGKVVSEQGGLGYKIGFACVPKELFHGLR
jgi:hypothetical protein